MEITCIDFETANPFWGSICAAGAAVIKDGKVSESFDTLIKPHSGHSEFNRDNIRVHGIKPEDVKGSPEFREFYEKRLEKLISGKTVAAHNVDFDIGCLKDALTLYDIPVPEFKYICTHEIARKAWEGLKNYKLKTVSRHLGFSFKHHDAGEDALACANIIVEAMKKYKAGDIEELARVLGVKVYVNDNSEKHVLSSLIKERRNADRVDARDIKPETDKFDKSHPLYGKELVFTGTLPSGMKRREAMQAAVNAGAKLSNYIRGKTDFLIAGEATTFRSGSRASSKMRKARKMAEQGAKIRIIGGEEFLAIIAKK